jgi:hypothetical protein
MAETLETMGVVVALKPPNEDPDRLTMGMVRVRLPMRHGENVKDEHLPWCMVAQDPSTKGYSSSTMPQPGTLVTVKMLDNKTGHGVVTGILPTAQAQGAGIPGNRSLNNQDWWKKAVDTVTTRIAPNIEEKTKDGVKIREIKEKDEKNKYSLYNGIPSNGALFPIVGLALPQLTQISTALDQYQNVLTPSMMANLPGMNMSLGGMFSMLQGELMNQINEKLPQELQGALQSISLFTQNLSTTTSGGFMIGGRVNPDVLLGNAVSILSEARSLYDLIDGVHRLQYDTTLHGGDTLEPITMDVEGAFGTFQQTIDAEGNITNNIPDVIMQLINLFLGMMTSASSFPGVNSNENMFGESAEVMANMFGRLPPEAQKAANDLMKKAVSNENSPSRKLNDIRDKVVTGKEVM